MRLVETMNLLAFDTGTEFMSIAVCCTADGQLQQWQHTTAGGAKASTDLIPAILDLMRQAGLRLQELDAICFGSGPGSFTGLRTACSVAQGLAFGAGVPVLAVDSLWALHAQTTGVVTALLDARMEEMYCATFAFDGGQWSELSGSALVQPEKLVRVVDPTESIAAAQTPWLLAGNVFAVYGERVAVQDPSAATAQRITALPTASAVLRLAPALLAAGKAVAAEHALPSYIRDKVAKTTAERMAEKTAVLAAAQSAVAGN
jgi:tRNA threonylcarbamoyladenosine biosynthesis protein TsaB